MNDNDRSEQQAEGTNQPSPTTREETQRIAKEQHEHPPETDNSAEAVRARQQAELNRQQSSDVKNNYVSKVFPVGELRCSCGNTEQVVLADADGNEIKPSDVACSNCGSTPGKPISHDEAHKDVPSWRKLRRQQAVGER